MFAKYFPDQIVEPSRIMYSNKKKVKDIMFALLPLVMNIALTIPNADAAQNIDIRASIAKMADEQFPKEKELIDHKNDELAFLHQNYKEFKEVHGVLTMIEKIPLCYNLVKYHIILKRKFIAALESGEFFKAYPD